MGVLDNYEPKQVFKYFEEICGIPHGSGNVDKISEYLVNFAKERNLKYRQDEKKNMIIWKDGNFTEGSNISKEPVIIQGHMDMVAVKTDDCKKNLEEEGLDLEIIEGDFISAKGTSLGGDDGIAIAYALALLDSEDIPHPPLEVVITVDEEVGMLGADYLDTSDLKGKTLLNIDSEDEGVFTVSCAGGATNLCHIPFVKEPFEGIKVKFKISGLMGGHSGVDIGLGRLNAISAVGRLLDSVREFNMRLASISGGEKDNAIARFCEAEIVVDEAQLEQVVAELNSVSEQIREEYNTVENGYEMNIVCANDTIISACPDDASTNNLIDILISMPNGVIRMNPNIENMVQTSMNLGVIKTEESEIMLTASLRSSNNSEKNFLSRRVKAIVENVNGTIEAEGVYPGWAYRENSKLRDKMIAVYEEQYGEKPIVEGIHAGLECGLFADKIKDLDCISFGPRIDDIHTTSEKMSISSVERTWKLLKGVLNK